MKTKDPIASLLLAGVVLAPPTVVAGELDRTPTAERDVELDLGDIELGRVPSPFDLQEGVLDVAGTQGGDRVQVAYGRRGTVTVTRGRDSASFLVARVSQITFEGGDGDDVLINETCIPVYAFGGGGDDQLTGGCGDDELVGGYGRDAIHGAGGDDLILGSGGSDTIDGGDGDDIIRAHGGQDVVRGGNGKDQIFPGSGHDTVYGDHGQDLIVTVGGGYDQIWGGYQWDNVWMDTSDWMADASSNEQSLGYIHAIGSFHAYWYGGYAQTIPYPKEPMGQDLPDPIPYASHAVTKVSYAGYPLFGPNGPTERDVVQGGVGDCYFVVQLASVAHQKPEEIRKLVTELGDGTYAVRFWRNGTPVYVRVDAELWTDGSQPKYARLGEGGAMWAPIVEKAYTFFRNKGGSYPSINGGNSAGGRADEHLGATVSSYSLSDLYDAQDIIDWNAAGRPSTSWIGWFIDTQVTGLLNHVDQQLAAGVPMYRFGKSGMSNTIAFTTQNWRRGQHAYSVVGVQKDTHGHPTGLIIRDPYTTPTQGNTVVTDFARIYFHLGGGTSIHF